MRKARVFMHGIAAGILEELPDKHFRFSYNIGYKGSPISLTLPIKNVPYDFDKFPHFFEGLLPEGMLLEAMLRIHKLDKNDYFGQIIKVGRDLVGAATIEEIV